MKWMWLDSWAINLIRMTIRQYNRCSPVLLTVALLCRDWHYAITANQSEWHCNLFIVQQGLTLRSSLPFSLADQLFISKWHPLWYNSYKSGGGERGRDEAGDRKSTFLRGVGGGKGSSEEQELENKMGEGECKLTSSDSKITNCLIMRLSQQQTEEKQAANQQELYHAFQQFSNSTRIELPCHPLAAL